MDFALDDSNIKLYIALNSLRGAAHYMDGDGIGDFVHFIRKAHVERRFDSKPVVDHVLVEVAGQIGITNAVNDGVGDTVDVVYTLAGVVVGSVVQIHRVVGTRPVHVILDGCDAIGIGVNECVQCRVLLGARAATGVGKTLK